MLGMLAVQVPVIPMSKSDLAENCCSKGVNFCSSWLVRFFVESGSGFTGTFGP